MRDLAERRLSDAVVDLLRWIGAVGWPCGERASRRAGDQEACPGHSFRFGGRRYLPDLDDGTHRTQNLENFSAASAASAFIRLVADGTSVDHS
jgi:hypothetical protein